MYSVNVNAPRVSCCSTSITPIKSLKVDLVDSGIYHLARHQWVFPEHQCFTSARLLFVQSHGAAWLANAETHLAGPGPWDVQHCWQSAAQVLQHKGMPPGEDGVSCTK